MTEQTPASADKKLPESPDKKSDDTVIARSDAPESAAQIAAGGAANPTQAPTTPISTADVAPCPTPSPAAADTDKDKERADALMRQLATDEQNKALEEPVKTLPTEPLPYKAPAAEAPEAAPETETSGISQRDMMLLSAAAASSQLRDAKIKSETETKPKDDRLTKFLITAAVIGAIAVAGYFAGAWLLSLAPVQGAIAGIMHGAGLAVTHVGAFLQGMGLISVAPTATAVATTLPAGATTAAGVVGGVGAAFVAMKSNITHMMGLDTVASGTATSTVVHHDISGSDHSAVALDHGAQTITTKMASKASQYAGEHDELTERRDDKKWVDRAAGENSFRDRLNSTGSHAAAVGRRGGNFAEELQEARQLQELMSAQPAR